jgi:hypothetical protein
VKRPFSSGLAFRVELSELKMGKERLDSRSRVAVGATPANLDTKCSNSGPCLLAAVIWSIVP